MSWYHFGQSTVERLLYFILLLTFVFTGVFFYTASELYHELKNDQTTEQQGITTLEKENYCFIQFFLLPDRTNVTIADLQACTPVIQGQKVGP